MNPLPLLPLALATQCLAADYAPVRQFDERNDVAVAASQFKGRADVEPKFAASVSERCRDVVADPIERLNVYPSTSGKKDSPAFDDDISSGRKYGGEPERRPVSSLLREWRRSEGACGDHPFDAHDDSRRTHPVEDAVYEPARCPACGCSKNGVDAHNALDAITKRLETQSRKLSKIKSRVTWTLVLVVLFYIDVAVDLGVVKRRM